MSLALFSSPPSTQLPSLSSPHSVTKFQLSHKPFLSLSQKRQALLGVFTCAAEEGSEAAAIAEEDKADVVSVAEVKVSEASEKKEEVKEESLGSNGSLKAATTGSPAAEVETVSTFQDPRWVGGTWDLTQFQKDGKTFWDAVIDAGEVFSPLVLVCAYIARV